MQSVLPAEHFLQYFVLHIEHNFTCKGKYFFQNKQILKILFLKNTTKKILYFNKTTTPIFFVTKKIGVTIFKPIFTTHTKKNNQ